jgi:hypothetical protein
MKEKIDKLPYHTYLLTPSKEMITGVLNDVGVYGKQMEEGKVYERKVSQLNDYTWYVLEIMKFTKDPNSWNSIISKLPSLSGFQKNLIITYLNLTTDARKKAETRILSNMDKHTLEVLYKYPIAAKVYYSKFDNQSTMYKNIMQLYLQFMLEIGGSCSLTPLPFTPSNFGILMENLNRNSKYYKQLVNSVAAVNLYLNEYQGDISLMFEKRTYGPEQFFNELYVPWMDDIFKNRVKSYWKRITHHNYYHKEIKTNFLTFWDKVGDTLQVAMKKVWGGGGKDDGGFNQPETPPDAEPVDDDSFDKEQNVKDLESKEKQDQQKSKAETQQEQQANTQQTNQQ